VLARGSRHHEVCRAALADALDHHLERLAGPAIDVAQQLGDPIGVLLADALERHPNTALARAVLREIPHDTVSLRDVALAARTITTPPPRDVIAGRRVLGSIGQGGYGHVYLVKHLALDRREALKTIHAHVAGDAQHRARFVREGKLQARVRHRNVVEIHDAGEEADGTLWIAMEYVRGTTLRTLLKQRDISREQAALVAESIGNALRAAHAQNVIHRDVKPANVLIEDATGDVKLSDFGIGAGGDLTEITQGGTPRSLAYAAPEQLDGPGTAASDVYALATTLFELVTGRRPFDDVEGSDFALMQAIKERPAPAPSSLIKGHATDWDALLMNALAKNADERPAPDELGARFARAVHESGVVRFPLEAREQRDIRPPSSARLRVSHGGAVRSVAFSPDGTRLATAGDDQSARVTDLETGREVLRMIHPWRRWHSRKLLSVALHPDGERIATAGRDDTAQVRHMHNGSVPLVLTHRLWVRTVTFSPNGELVATAGSDGTARVWNLPEERVHLTITSDKPLNAVAFSHDSTRLATAGDDGSACVWDLADTDSQGSGDAGPLSCVTHDDAVWAVAFSPDGRSLATASSDRSAWVSHLGGTSEPLRLEHDGAVWSVAFSPDGRQLATAGADALARVWDLTDFREVLAVEHDDVIFQVTFSPEGHRLATASADHTARVWEL
jgi:serine/threonine protein kinase